MHNGNAGRRPRNNKRGGKREFGDSQNYGQEFEAPNFFNSNTEAPSYEGQVTGGYSTPSDDRQDKNYYQNSGRDDYQGGNDRGPGSYGAGNQHGHGGNRRPYGNANQGGFRGAPHQRREYPPVERGPRQQGTVKFFKQDKGFGFITPDVGEADVFVHISAVERSGFTTLESGARISFETEPDRRGKGPKAVELRLEDISESGQGSLPSEFTEE